MNQKTQSGLTDRMRNVQVDSLVVGIIGFLVSLGAHDALHVAGPAVRIGHQGTRGRRQTLRDCRLLNLYTVITKRCKYVYVFTLRHSLTSSFFNEDLRIYNTGAYF